MNASILTDCPAGRWSNTTGLTAFTQCTECIAGRYGNITGAINQNNACPYTCAAGRYGNVSGQTSSDSVTMCAVCPLGSYCTGGANIAQCPAGRWSGITSGLTNVSDCSECDAGRYGSVIGAATATMLALLCAQQARMAILVEQRALIIVTSAQLEIIASAVQISLHV